MKKFFITTTLPYANAGPHIGHALEFVLADVIARRYRDIGTVVLNVGLDQHGSKIAKAALADNKYPGEFLKGIKTLWEGFCERLNVSYDVFYETSTPEHHARVKEVFQDLLGKGLIIQKDYTAKYCTGCESFKKDSELVNGECPDHPGQKTEEVSEKNWFLLLSKLKLNGIGEIIPDKKINEYSELLSTVEDISISRNKEKAVWGIPVPGDDDQLIYVWFDALLNYYFASDIGWDNFDERIQLCGPDNLRFQSIIWQAMLSGIGAKYTDTLLVHGTVLDEHGHKMSKTVGNVIDPEDMITKYGSQALRYYLVGVLPNWSDTGFSEDAMIESCNADLADNFGNLVGRVTTLLRRKNISFTKAINTVINHDGHNFLLMLDEPFHLLDRFEVHLAAREMSVLVKEANRFINDEKPWGKDTDPDKAEKCLIMLQRFLLKASKFYGYYCPDVGWISKSLLDGSIVGGITFKKLERSLNPII